MSPCSRPLGRSRRFGNACGSSDVRGGTIGTYGQFGNADGGIGLFTRSYRYLPIVREPEPYGCNPSGWVIVPSDGAMPSLDQEVGLDMGLPPAGERFAGIATLPLRFVAWSEAVQSAAGTS